MKATRYDKKQMIDYHLLSTTHFEGTPLFRPMGLSSHCASSAARPAIGIDLGAAGRGFPEDGPPPPYQGYAYAHRSLFLQFSQKAGSLAASVLFHLGAGGEGNFVHRALSRRSRGRGNIFIRLGRLNEKRTPRSLSLRLNLLGDLLWVGAHALSRAPTGALSGKVS